MDFQKMQQLDDSQEDKDVTKYREVKVKIYKIINLFGLINKKINRREYKFKKILTKQISKI